ncbi:integrase, catalytic region, zinc finger, CCHC-type containing protein [Tanacetum coccineum]
MIFSQVLVAQICIPFLCKTQLLPIQICLMAKAISPQAWLWHRRLSHLNFDTINLLSKNNIVNGLPKLTIRQRSSRVLLVSWGKQKESDGGGMMRRWCGCGDEVRGGCDDGDDGSGFGGVTAGWW